MWRAQAMENKRRQNTVGVDEIANAMQLWQRNREP